MGSEDRSSSLAFKVIAGSGQIIASPNLITNNTSRCWEYTNMSIHSGFGIVLIGPELPELLGPATKTAPRRIQDARKA